MSILFALLAAFSNAVNVVTQHVASHSDPEASHGWKLVRYLLTSPLWLIGWVALIAAFVLQAAALHNGLLSLVQILLMTELVFALVLRRLWLRERIGIGAWGSALLTCAAVSLFVIAAEPRGGLDTATRGAWASSIVACVGLAGLLALCATRGSPARRSALLATSAGIVWALEATFIKTMTDTLTASGLSGVFTGWAVYAVAVTGAAGVLLVQSALHVGPLRTSQPLLVIVDPVVSIVLSIHLFGERLTPSPTDLVLASVSLVAMCAGVVFLTRTVTDGTEPSKPQPPT